MELLIGGAAFVGGFYLGKWLPLPELKSRWSMFFLRSLVLFIILQVGVVLGEYRYIVWAAGFGYVWKGFRYGAGLERPKREVVEENEPVGAREFPRPPVGPGKNKKKRK